MTDSALSFDFGNPFYSRSNFISNFTISAVPNSSLSNDPIPSEPPRIPPISPQILGAVPGRNSDQFLEGGDLRDRAPSFVNSSSFIGPRNRLSSNNLPDEMVSEDVSLLLKKLNISKENVLYMERSDIVTLADIYEKDPAKNIVLRTNFMALRDKLLVPTLPRERPEEQNKSVASVDTARFSTFGSAFFPDADNVARPRETPKWPLVLGRTYRGFSDSVPVSSFCSKLISVGIRESLSNVEFYRMVMENLDIDLNVEAINYLIKHGVVDDSKAAQRLSCLYDFLKARFALTDNTSVLQSKLERLSQGTSSVAEYSELFMKHLEELKMAQGSSAISESYKLSTFKRGLHEKYRIFADDQQYNIKTLSDLISALLIWEQAYFAREEKFPNSKTPSKLKLSVAEKIRCPFCRRGFHSESDCWEKFPNLRPPKCSVCEKFHRGKCFGAKTSNTGNDSSKFKMIGSGEVMKTTFSSVVDFQQCGLLKVEKPWVVRLDSFGLESLLDTGASCSMISGKVAVEVLNSYPKTSSLIKLPNPVTVQFGDAKKIMATQSVILSSALNGCDLELLIIPCLSVPVIIGQGDIRAHHLIKEVTSYAAQDMQSDHFENKNSKFQFSRNDEGHIVVSCPMFENASILPWREKQRSHSEVELKIMDNLVDDMLVKKQLRKVSPQEVLIVQEIILVDKLTAKGIAKPKTFPPEEGRYRLVLDSRPANALRFDQSTGSWIVNNLLFGPSRPSETNELRQSQMSSLSQVESIPRKDRKIYAKIDLKNAFYSTYTTEKLSKLFGFKHRDQYYCFMVIPMGWFLSALVFQDVVSYVISLTDIKIPNVFVKHQQDDILIVGDSIENVQLAMNQLTQKFTECGFIIKPEKCEGPSDSVIFCGLKLLPDGGVKPWPVKRQLDNIAAATAAELFMKAKTVAETKHVLKSWLGTANYYSKWLPADLREQNLFLHTTLHKLDTGEVSRKEVVEAAMKFVEDLCFWWLTNSFALYGGGDGLEDTLIVTDSNVSGWTGCIFRLIQVNKDAIERPLPFSLDGLLSSHEKDLIPPEKSIDDYALAPVRFDGARWDTLFEKSQSSTWRERAAAMLITHRNRDCLSGKVFILSDNKNLVGSWKNSESLTASLCNAFQTYIGHVHDAIHVKRSHPIIMWVDNSARNLSISNLAVKRISSEPQNIGKREKVDNIDNLSDDEELSDVDLSSESSDLEGDADILSGQPDEEETSQNDMSNLLDKGWIYRQDGLFYTTDKLPGNVAPDSFVILEKDAHDVLTSIHRDYGHPTIAGMRKILHLWKLWIFNFYKHAKDVVSSCMHCLECRDTYHPMRSSIPMVRKPMEMIMVDFLQPEKSSQPAFIVIRDRYSGYVEGRAIEKMDSFEVRQLLLEWISRFGAPLTFLSDNAEAFSANIMENLYSKYKITHRKTPIYDPQANGSVERTIKTIEEGLRIELESGSPPQEAIHIVCGRINRTISVPGNPESIAPRSVIFGFDELNPFVPRSIKTFNFAHDLAIGQRVLTKIQNAPKLSRQFEDTGCTIHGIEGNHVYSLLDANGKLLKNFYRRERLKPLLPLRLIEDNLKSLSWGEVCG